MADEHRFLDPNQTSLTNLQGSVSDTHEDPTTTQTAWLTASDTGSDTQIDGVFNPPSEALSGTQEFQVRVRATTNGTDDPNVTITLDDGSTPVSSTAVPNGSEVVFDAADGLTLSTSAISDPSAVALTVDGAATGGNPNSRDTVEVGAVRWAVSLDQFLDIATIEPTNITTESATIRADLNFGSYNSVDVWFEWRQVGGSWTITDTQTFTEPATVTESLTNLSEDTEYEYRVYADADSGTETAADEAGQTFWTALLVAGTVTAGGNLVGSAPVYITDVAAEETTQVVTASDGSFSIEMPGGAEYHVAGQYGGTEDPHAGGSYPGISGDNT